MDDGAIGVNLIHVARPVVKVSGQEDGGVTTPRQATAEIGALELPFNRLVVT